MKKSIFCFLLVISLLVGLSASASEVSNQTSIANQSSGSNEIRLALAVSTGGGCIISPNGGVEQTLQTGSMNFSFQAGDSITLRPFVRLSGYKFAGYYMGIRDSGGFVSSYSDKLSSLGTGNLVINANSSQTEYIYYLLFEKIEDHTHTWGSPTYTWSSDNSSITATRTCTADTSHVETETVGTTPTITKAATCTVTGVKTYTATFTNTAFATQTKTEEIPVDANAHTWGAWTTTKTATETEEGEETRTCSSCGKTETRTIARLTVEYSSTEGNGSVWEKESSSALKFVFKRNINDNVTFSRFTKVLVDGNTLAEENYTTAAGSLIITLKQAYLETLSTGSHTLSAYFSDYRAPVDAHFTVQEKSAGYHVPKTGDDEPLLLWTLISLAGLSLIICTFVAGKRGGSRK